MFRYLVDEQINKHLGAPMIAIGTFSPPCGDVGQPHGSPISPVDLLASYVTKDGHADGKLLNSACCFRPSGCSVWPSRSSRSDMARDADRHSDLQRYRRSGCQRSAVALAAQPRWKNLIGGVILYADRMVRVGEYCEEFEGFAGTVEAIGIRSTPARARYTLILMANSISPSARSSISTVVTASCSAIPSACASRDRARSN
ncbi:MAG: mechanosensitive ion channel [Alphaproteobacteria bacterium]|nr:mechanosensitive ion channel [Alphaproteobacteria bacterium]